MSFVQLDSLEIAFGAILHAAWQGGVLALLVLAVTRGFGGRLRPSWRFALWLVVLTRLAIPWLPAAPWSLYALMSNSDSRTATVESPPVFGDTLDSEGGFPPAAVVANTTDAAPASGNNSDARLSMAADTSAIPTPVAPSPSYSRMTASQWQALTWFAGVAVLIIRMIWQTLCLTRSRARWSSADPPLADLLDRTCVEAGLSRPVALYLANTDVGPATFGLLRPCIVIPERLTTALSVEELRLILLHEAIHVRRRDPLIDMAASAVAAFHWFNPAAWLALVSLRREREFACDAALLDQAGEGTRKSYGQVLLRTVELLQPPERLAGAVAMFGGRFSTDPVAARIGSIVKHQPASRAARLGSLVLLLLVMGIGLTDAVAERCDEGESQTAATGTAPSSVDANASARTDDFGDPLPKGALARLGTERFRSVWSTRGMGFASDDRTLVTSEEGRIFLWDIATGRKRREIPVKSHSIIDLLLTSDGRQAATIGIENDPASATPQVSLCLWELESGELRAQHEQFEHPGNSKYALLPDGRHFVAGSTPGAVGATIVIREFPTGREVKRIDVGNHDHLGSLAVSPDGETVAISSANDLYLWEWKTDKAPSWIFVNRHLVALAFSPDGSLLAEGPDSKPDIAIRNVKTREVVQSLALPDQRRMAVNSLAFTPDGQRLITTNSILFSDYEFPHRIQMWSIATGKILREFGTQSAKLALSRDGRWLAAGSIPIHAWNPETGESVAVGEAGHQGSVNSIRFAQSGKLVVTSSDDGTVRLWDASTGAERHVISHGGRWVRSIAISPDGRSIGSAALDNSLRIIEAATGHEAHRFEGHGNLGGKRALVFSPDGRELLSFGDDWQLQVRDVATGRLLREVPLKVWFLGDNEEEIKASLSEHFPLEHVDFSPEASKLLIGYRSTMKVVDTTTEEITTVFTPATGGDRWWTAAWSPDGKRLAAISRGTSE